MLKLLACAQGHYWEKPVADGAAEAREVCPVCGQFAETMPLLDLAPSANESPLAVAPPPPAPLRDKEGRPLLAGYEILHELGTSPTGVHRYRARQVLVNRTVVLKVVFAKDDPGQLAWGSLRGEANALGRLVHPNIVSILEAGERERQLFYNAVEQVDGPALAELLIGKPLPIRQAVALIETLARAVHQAHQKNLVHRNLKPASILLAVQNEEGGMRKADEISPPFCILHSAIYLPKITDFGLARRPVEGDACDVELQGELPCYLAPEQAWGRVKEIGPATDIYALGAILYELIGGQPPFREASAAETLDAIQSREPAPPSRLRSGVPRDLDAICRKCLAKQPRRRYASALDLADDLRRHVNRQPIKARPAGNVERLGKWLRRNVRGVSLVLLGVSLAGLLAAIRRPAAGLQPFREQGYRQTISRLESDLLETRRRETVADYLRYLLLAERAADAHDAERAQEMLSRCPAELRHWEWGYLRGRLQGRIDSAEFATEFPILCMDLSRDGRYLAAGGGSEPASDFRVARGEVSVWDLSKRERLWHWKLNAPARGVTFGWDRSLAIAGGGKQGTRNTIQLRDLQTGLPRFTPRSFAEGTPLGVAAGADSRLLPVMSDDGKLRVLRADTGADVQTHEVWFSPLRPRGLHARLLPMPTPTEPNRVALVSPDGGQIVLCADLYQPNPPIEFRAPDETTYLALAYDSNDKLAAGGLDRTIRLWEVRFPQQPALTLRGHKGGVSGVSFSADGKRLASCGQDGTVRIWDVEQGLELLTLTGYHGASGVLFPRAQEGFEIAQQDVGMPEETDRLAIAHDNKVTVLVPPPRQERRFGR